jgi:EAL domain-containing protein (putative c-di-GMP-specific phosphodiesterase class I)
MAHDLGMDTVAEGVETVEQLDRLQELGCNYGQGYLLSRPVAKEEIEALLNAPIDDSTPQPKSTKPA